MTRVRKNDPIQNVCSRESTGQDKFWTINAPSTVSPWTSTVTCWSYPQPWHHLYFWPLHKHFCALDTQWIDLDLHPILSFCVPHTFSFPGVLSLRGHPTYDPSQMSKPRCWPPNKNTSLLTLGFILHCLVTVTLWYWVTLVRETKKCRV
jgi:hypothetical protein